MTKKLPSIEHDQNIVNALNKLPQVIFDKKHNMSICLDNSQVRSNENRFEHIAKKYHQLKVRDIERIPNGIVNYVKYEKDKNADETYCYYIDRGGSDKGFIKVFIKLYANDKSKAYIKTIYIVYRLFKKE